MPARSATTTYGSLRATMSRGNTMTIRATTNSARAVALLTPIHWSLMHLFVGVTCVSLAFHGKGKV